jgi:hypothetical protein
LYVDWDMLAGPKLQAAANLAGMHRQVKEDGTQAQRDFRERYQKLVEEDGPARQQEMELIKARQAREKAMGELINKFWGN